MLFRSNKRKAFYGKCLVVVQNNGQGGVSQLTATGKGLKESRLDILSVDVKDQGANSYQLSNK